MNSYPLEVCITVEVPAPSLEDALSAAEDLFGAGEMEGFDVNVTSFIVKEL
jgi:hypothetical protein